MAAKRIKAKANDKFGWANGIPPVAAKVVCVDFDQTIFPWGALMDRTKPILEGADSAMQELKAAGYTIVILTSRLSSKWLTAEWDDPEAARAEQIEYVSDLLSRWGCPFDEITAEKPPAEVYFDDKASLVSDRRPLWVAVAEFLTGKESYGAA